MARRTRPAPNPLADLITPGAIFDTCFETGCVALAAPDVDGNFDARDSDGIVCEFGAAMVIAVRAADAAPDAATTRPLTDSERGWVARRAGADTTPALADWERELLATAPEPQPAPTGCTLSSIPGHTCPNPLAGPDVPGGTLGCAFHLAAIEDNPAEDHDGE